MEGSDQYLDRHCLFIVVPPQRTFNNLLNTHVLIPLAGKNETTIKEEQKPNSNLGFVSAFHLPPVHFIWLITIKSLSFFRYSRYSQENMYPMVSTCFLYYHFESIIYYPFESIRFLNDLMKAENRIATTN